MSSPPQTRTALTGIDSWDVPHVAAVVVRTDGRELERRGPTDLPLRLASISKLITAFTVMIGVEEEAISLDDEVGPPGSTLRHLLAHTSGLGFDSTDPARVAPGVRRLYSNHGIEMAAAHLADESGIAFPHYLHEALLAPLAMTSTTLAPDASPAHAIHSTVDDLQRFVAQVCRPTLLAPQTVSAMIAVQFPGLAGFIPGVGRFDPCDWGLGFERNFGRPGHWAGARISGSAFGHFGGAGTFLWVDPAADVACVCLTDRPFDTWAMDVWPVLGDRVIDTYGSNSPMVAHTT